MFLGGGGGGEGGGGGREMFDQGLGWLAVDCCKACVGWAQGQGSSGCVLMESKW